MLRDVLEPRALPRRPFGPRGRKEALSSAQGAPVSVHSRPRGARVWQIAVSAMAVRGSWPSAYQVPSVDLSPRRLPDTELDLIGQASRG